MIQPSDMIALGDSSVKITFIRPGAVASEWNGIPAGRVYFGGNFSVFNVAPAWEVGLQAFSDPEIEASVRFIRARHGGRWNVNFCDNHIEKLKVTALFDTRKDAVLSRWNKDNLPHREIGVW